jgi:hypothetical protein
MSNNAVGRVPPLKRLIVPDAASLRYQHELAVCGLDARRAERGRPARLGRPLRLAARVMSASDPNTVRMIRDNAYLMARNAQLQDDVTALSAEVERLRQAQERLQGRIAARSPNPLGSGQSA